MSINFDSILIILICYLVGSIPFGLLISILLKKNDPRYSGSRNIGATNIVRTSGWGLGLLTLTCDIFKGYIPLLIFKDSLTSFESMILFLFLGHLFPIWIKFRGGKGIAVLIGSLAAYNSFFLLNFYNNLDMRCYPYKIFVFIRFNFFNKCFNNFLPSRR